MDMVRLCRCASNYILIMERLPPQRQPVEYDARRETRVSAEGHVLFWVCYAIGAGMSLFLSDKLTAILFGHYPDRSSGMLSLVGLALYTVIVIGGYAVLSWKRGRESDLRPLLGLVLGVAASIPQLVFPFLVG